MTVPTEERPLVNFALFACSQEEYIREAVEDGFSQVLCAPGNHPFRRLLE